MRGYFGLGQLSATEKQDILDQHKSLYNGYQTMQPQVSNTQPLYTYDFAGDKDGMVVNNKGEVKKYTNMGTALQIEMALEQARAFEEELKMLFMQTGKIDVWNKIKARQAEMDADDAQEIRLYNAQERARKQKEQELNEWAMILGGSAFVLFLLFIGGYELVQFCQTGNRCGR